LATEARRGPIPPFHPRLGPKPPRMAAPLSASCATRSRLLAFRVAAVNSRIRHRSIHRLVLLRDPARLQPYRGRFNQQLAAVRRLAHEAADSGLLSPELAAGISRVKGVRQLGFRSGNWLTEQQSSDVTFRGERAVLRGWLLLFRFRNKIEVVNSSEHIPMGQWARTFAPLSGGVGRPLKFAPKRRRLPHLACEGDNSVYFFRLCDSNRGWTTPVAVVGWSPVPFIGIPPSASRQSAARGTTAALALPIYRPT
jgi:hypothetical protein